jgi:hypothetical protein
MKTNYLLLVLVLLLCTTNLFAQEKKVAVSGFEGAVVAGYVDEGGFLNFIGPNISYKMKAGKLMLGMLPSLRYKEDKSAVKNAPILPALGVGLSYNYKHLMLQLPLYYNNKTATQNGCWKPGFGIGYRF